MIRVPITTAWSGSNGQVLGFMQIDEKLLPDAPDFVFACGYRELTKRIQPPGTPDYVLLECCLVQDSEYAAFLAEREKQHA